MELNDSEEAVTGLSERQQRYLELMREPTFVYQHLHVVVPPAPAPRRRPQSSAGPRKRVEPEAFSIPCPRDPTPSRKLKYRFTRSVRWPESTSAECDPGPGHYHGASRIQSSSAPILVSRRPLRAAGVGIPENNPVTGPGSYTLPLPMLSGTPASRPSTFAKGERTMSHVRAPATHATYDVPDRGSSGHGARGYTFSVGGQDEALPPTQTPGPGQYNPRWANADKEATQARMAGRPRSPLLEQEAPGPGTYVTPDPRDLPTTVPAAGRAPCYSFAAQPYHPPPLDESEKLSLLQRSHTAQELYSASLTPDGRAHEASRQQLRKTTRLERCATAPLRRVEFAQEKEDAAERRREARATKFAPVGKEAAEKRQAARIAAARLRLGWLVASALARSVAPMRAALEADRLEKRKVKAAKAILRTWRQTATVQTRNKAEAGRERYFVRRIENAMRDWIYRLRLQKWNDAANLVVFFLREAEKTSQMARAVRQLTHPPSRRLTRRVRQPCRVRLGAPHAPPLLFASPLRVAGASAGTPSRAAAGCVAAAHRPPRRPPRAAAAAGASTPPLPPPPSHHHSGPLRSLPRAHPRGVTPSLRSGSATRARGSQRRAPAAAAAATATATAAAATAATAQRRNGARPRQEQQPTRCFYTPPPPHTHIPFPPPPSSVAAPLGASAPSVPGGADAPLSHFPPPVATRARSRERRAKEAPRGKGTAEATAAAAAAARAVAARAAAARAGVVAARRRRLRCIRCRCRSGGSFCLRR